MSDIIGDDLNFHQQALLSQQIFIGYAKMRNARTFADKLAVNLIIEPAGH